MIRYAWAPTANSDDPAAFEAGIAQYACHEVACNGQNQCNGNQLLNNPTSCTPCQGTITVPTWVADGSWTLQWVWYGGGGGFQPYYSCVDYIVSAGAAVTAKTEPKFVPGDARSTTSCGVCANCDKSFPRGVGPTIQQLEAKALEPPLPSPSPPPASPSPVASPEAAAAPVIPPGAGGSTGTGTGSGSATVSRVMCTACWPGTSGMCQDADSVCWGMLPSGDCPPATHKCSEAGLKPVGDVHVGKNMADNAQSTGGLSSWSEYALGYAPQPSASPMPAARLTNPDAAARESIQSNLDTVMGNYNRTEALDVDPNNLCRNCWGYTGGECQAPNGVCWSKRIPSGSSVGSCPAGTAPCAIDRTRNIADNRVAGAQCRSGLGGVCDNGSSGQCFVPTRANGGVCVAAINNVCDSRSFACEGTSLAVGAVRRAAAVDMNAPVPAEAAPALPRRTAASPTTGKKVVAYYGGTHAARRVEAAAGSALFPEQLPTSGMTHLVYAGAARLVAPDGAQTVWTVVAGELEDVNGAGDSRGGLYARTVSHFADSGVQVLLSLGGPQAGAKLWSQLCAAGNDARTAVANAAVDLATQYGFDGLELDAEWIGDVATGGDPSDKAGFVQFVRALSSAARGASLLLSVTLPPDARRLAGYDLPALTPAVDWFSVMAFDLHGPWEATTGHGAPLRDASGFGIDIVTAVRTVVDAAVPRSKLVLATAAHGRRWLLTPAATTMVSRWANVPAAGPASQPGAPPGFLTHSAVLAFVSGGAAQSWDSVAQQHYAWTNVTWATYESQVSMRAKADLAREEGLGGVALVALDTDDAAGGFPLFSALRSRFVAVVSTQRVELWLRESAQTASDTLLSSLGVKRGRALQREYYNGWGYNMTGNPHGDSTLIPPGCMAPEQARASLAAALNVPALSISIVSAAVPPGTQVDTSSYACPKSVVLTLRATADRGLPVESNANKLTAAAVTRYQTATNGAAVAVPGTGTLAPFAGVDSAAVSPDQVTLSILAAQQAGTTLGGFDIAGTKAVSDGGSSSGAAQSSSSTPADSTGMSAGGVVGIIVLVVAVLAVAAYVVRRNQRSNSSAPPLPERQTGAGMPARPARTSQFSGINSINTAGTDQAAPRFPQPVHQMEMAPIAPAVPARHNVEDNGPPPPVPPRRNLNKVW